MNDLMQEMLYCELLLLCETTGCNAIFESEEPAHEPIEAWCIRAASAAQSIGWTIGHTGLVKCPKCSAKTQGGN
ncbi:hypothetical protein BH11PSE11_BH11PSE11_04850 [soil metagenome]